jgi:hypothetical protein
VREFYSGRVLPVVNGRLTHTFTTPDTALFELVP